MSGDHNQYQKPGKYDPMTGEPYPDDFIDALKYHTAKYSDIVSDGGLDPRNKFDNAPEPVGWIYEDDEGRMMFSQMPHPDPLWEPVYKAAPKRKWVGLTDEEVFAALVAVDGNTQRLAPGFIAFYRAIEARLKAKNG